MSEQLLDKQLRLRPGHELIVRGWGDQCVVHHLASNDTLRMQAWAGQLMVELGNHATWQGRALLEARPDLKPDELEQLLAELFRRDWLEVTHG